MHKVSDFRCWPVSRPNQAAKLRPSENRIAVPIAATKRVGFGDREGLLDWAKSRLRIGALPGSRCHISEWGICGASRSVLWCRYATK